jgi:hypothetical protein
LSRFESALRNIHAGFGVKIAGNTYGYCVEVFESSKISVQSSKRAARTWNSPLSRQSWQCSWRVSAKSCLSAASSFGRAGWAASFEKPKAGLAGAPFFAYFLWQDKESKLPPGNPRQLLRVTLHNSQLFTLTLPSPVEGEGMFLRNIHKRFQPLLPQNPHEYCVLYF